MSRDRGIKRWKREREREEERGRIFSLSSLLVTALIICHKQSNTAAREGTSREMQGRQARSEGTRHEARGTRYADEGPNSASRLTNARMRPGANAHAVAAPAAGRPRRRPRHALSPLSPALFLLPSPPPPRPCPFLSFSFSLFNDLTGVQNTKLQPILRFVRPPRVWGPGIRRRARRVP